MTKDTIKKEKKKILLRFEDQMWNELQHWASDELRSINAQIEYILKNAVLGRRKNLKKMLSQMSEMGKEKELDFLRKLFFNPDTKE